MGNKSYCSWVATISWLVFFLIAICLAYIIVDLIRDNKPDENCYVDPVIQETSYNELLEPLTQKEKVGLLKMEIQSSTKEVEDELKDRISELEESNKEISKIIYSLEESNKELSMIVRSLDQNAKFLSERIINTESSIDSVKVDLKDKYEKTDTRIDYISDQLKEVLEDIKTIRLQVDSNTSIIKDLYQIVENNKKLSDENKMQIEDIKLMFVNYDMVLAIEKAKRNKGTNHGKEN